MKDYYMIFVLAAVLITPFLPGLLRAKCPSCNKRSLLSLQSPEEANNYISTFQCKSCQKDFHKEKSGPLKEGLSS